MAIPAQQFPAGRAKKETPKSYSIASAEGNTRDDCAKAGWGFSCLPGDLWGAARNAIIAVANQRFEHV